MAKRQPKHTMVRIRGPNGTARLEDLLRDRYTVGRGENGVEVDFPVPEDQHLSRQHLALVREGETYLVENLSPNGTDVNGKTISAPRKLKHKDRIEAGGETSLEFLILTDEERARELKAGAGPKAAAKKKVPLYKRPVFIVMAVVYGLIALGVAAALGTDEVVVSDPKEGPYFEWMKTDPIRAIGRIEEDAAGEMRGEAARPRVEAMWQRVLAEHGGPLLAEGDHAYRLVDEARKLLGTLGYKTLNDGVDNNERIAMYARDVLEELEARVKNLYNEADRYVKAGYYRQAYAQYEQIVDAVPGREELIRRFALYRMAKLKPRLGRR
jgi:pSer/pThr/pTyr-binding forkhead associated (FHA) protein